MAEALQGPQSSSNIFSIPWQLFILLGIKRIFHLHLVILYHDAISFLTQHAITLFMSLYLSLVSLLDRPYFELICILLHLGSNDKVEAFVSIILTSNLEYCSKQGSSKVHQLVESLIKNFSSKISCLISFRLLWYWVKRGFLWLCTFEFKLILINLSLSVSL